MRSVNVQEKLILLLFFNLKQEWVLVFWNKIQTHEKLKRMLFIVPKHNSFLPSNIRKQLNQKHTSTPHLIFTI